MNRVEGKVAIVTGSARGMGAAFARRLVEEGAKVVLTDILADEGSATAATLGKNAHFLHHDVSSQEDWQNIVAQTESKFGPVSVLVNNAAITYYGTIEDLQVSEFKHVFEVNQLSVYLGMKLVLPSMKRAGGGSIINLSSVAGLVGVPGALAYVGSKFAVTGMTKAAAIELAAYNIRVNSIHPGSINTPMFAVCEREDIRTILKGVPAARVGEPVEVANIVLMLASDECCYSTGAEFVVDGGLSCC